MMCFRLFPTGSHGVFCSSAPFLHSASTRARVWQRKLEAAWLHPAPCAATRDPPQSRPAVSPPHLGLTDGILLVHIHAMSQTGVWFLHKQLIWR